MRRFLFFLLLCATAIRAGADDGAASIAAGGLVLMKREPRIVMAKEVLDISPNKVRGDYEFRNDAAEDISTEVAFPIPAFGWDPEKWAPPPLAGFDDFKLWVNGEPTQFAVEVRALVGKKDVTALLRKYGVDPASLGHVDDSSGPGASRDARRLGAAAKSVLAKAGAIGGPEGLEPEWRVEKKYHWLQMFPAHGTVQIRHEYTPVLGNSNALAGPDFTSLCPSPALTARQQKPDAYVPTYSLSYVDFILTTANTWKTPIEDFTLTVERTQNPTTQVSFCWKTPVTKVDANHFSAHLSNFVPTRELRVGYIVKAKQ